MPANGAYKAAHFAICLHNMLDFCTMESILAIIICSLHQVNIIKLRNLNCRQDGICYCNHCWYTKQVYQGCNWNEYTCTIFSCMSTSHQIVLSDCCLVCMLHHQQKQLQLQVYLPYYWKCHLLIQPQHNQNNLNRSLKESLPSCCQHKHMYWPLHIWQMWLNERGRASKWHFME